METLKPGDRAPDFSVSDIHGNPVKLFDYGGRKVLLSFFRFATCPFCTVRFVRLTQEAERYAQQGVEIIAVFESSRDYIHEYLNKRPLPFPVIADPEGELYARYGLKKSVKGLLFGMFRMPTLLRALFDPAFHLGKPDSSVLRIPADFLIDSNGRITDSYYGSDIGDHIPFKRIDYFAGTGVQAGVA
ncbi:MAG: peroxiredoxin family protein [Chromatiales bacterium]|nr:AhpC/TSA family protein [Gammaproteobacteria bacterium]MBW6475828.1 peroxiredoxin family protein [Chromatiales bacterium]